MPLSRWAMRRSPPRACVLCGSGYWIVATFGKWVAAQDAPQCEGAAFEGAVFCDGFDGVGGTGGHESAGGAAFEGGEVLLIKTDDGDEAVFNDWFHRYRVFPLVVKMLFLKQDNRGW